MNMTSIKSHKTLNLNRQALLANKNVEIVGKLWHLDIEWVLTVIIISGFKKTAAKN